MSLVRHSRDVRKTANMCLVIHSKDIRKQQNTTLVKHCKDVTETNSEKEPSQALNMSLVKHRRDVREITELSRRRDANQMADICTAFQELLDSI